MSFKILEIPDVIKSSMEDEDVWQKGCPVSIDKLRLLEVTHIDFNGRLQSGQIIVHHKIAGNVITIFQELLAIKFPIHKMRLMDEYEADDELSMKNNNSSAFVFRNIPGSDTISMHSYGLAVDINPVQNPYVTINVKDGEFTVHPKEGGMFLNRHNLRPGMLEPVVHIFRAHALSVWGGDWNNPIDYHHFQVPGDKRGEFLTE
jgi:hypothetical protein